MTNEQVLEKQVEALEKLLQLKEAVINELENKVQRLQAPITNVPNYAPSQWQIPSPSYQTTHPCVNGQPHQYPQVWNGINHPPCTVCGHTPSTYQGQWITVSGGSANVPLHTSGYIQPVKTLSVDGISETTLTLVNAANK